jgi:hypothetical protein
VLTMPHHISAMIDPFTPARGADGITKTAKLIAGTTIKLEATVDGKLSVSGAPSCQGLAPPAECTVAPGTYTIEVTGNAGVTVRAKRSVTVGATDLTVRFELGFVEAAAGKQIELGGGAVAHKVALEAGARTVVVGDDAGTHSVAVKVRTGATTIVK